MSYAFSNYYRNLIRDYTFRTTPGGGIPPASIYVDLLKTLPTDKDGTSIAPLAMTGYAIKQVTQLDANWSGTSDGETDNVAAIDYTTLTGTGERAIGVAIYDAVGRTNLLMFGPLATAWQGCDGNDTGDVFTAQAHGYSNDDRVFLRGENLPTGVTAAIEYYIVGSTTDTFQVSLTQGGGAVALTADGYGDVGASKAKDIGDGDQVKFNAGTLDIQIDF